MNKLNELNMKIGKYRWTICALVFFATTVNYLDRNVLGLLKQTLSDVGVFGLDKGNQELYYSRVVQCFQIAYAVGMLGAGRVIDKLGTKKGYAYSLISWSIAAIGHAFGQHTVSFGFWRAALGVSEAGNFPAANKTIAEWFPRKERALATGLYNSGANIGSIVAPLTVPYIASAWGWEWAFVITGIVGLTWLVFWYAFYASPASKLESKHLTQAEFDYIHSDIDESDVQKVGLDSYSKPNYFKRIVSAKGRAMRGEFWGIFIVAIIVLGAAWWILAAVSSQDQSANTLLFSFIKIVGGLMGLFTAWIIVAVATRRWHDLGLSGWFVIVNVVLGIFAFIYQGIRKGENEANKYGDIPNPTIMDFRQTWAFSIGKFLTDPIWWFFLFWLPAFLIGENARKVHDFMAANPTFTGGPEKVPGVISWPIAIAVIYTVSTVGSIAGGWLPKRLMHSGMEASRARKVSMFIIALLPLSVLLASKLGAINTWFAVATIAIACAGHQAWSANIFTTVSDMFPKRAVASVTGIGGMAGAIGGMLIAGAAGELLKFYANRGHVEMGYAVLFVVCGSAYLIAWVAMHLLAPKFQQVQLAD